MLAVAYYRTSSRTNVGFDKDSLTRQQNSCRSWAKANGVQIVADNGAKAILVESASRFARDLSVQILGHQKLQEMGIQLIAVDSPTAFTEDTPTAELVRSLLGAVSQFEKATVVARLASGRERKKRLTGKGQGRKRLTDIHPELQNIARQLRRKCRKTGKRLSYDKVAAALYEQGYATSKDNQYSAATVKSLVQ